MRDCTRHAAECGLPDADCDADCENLDLRCEREYLDLYTCQSERPADCQDPATDVRSAAAIPCIVEIDALLTCAGFPSGD